LASEGANDGDGKMTYLRGKSKYELGKWYHVAAVYDGAQLRLYVNGELDATSDQQSGDILYPREAPVVIGAHRDRNENNFHRGRIREATIYDLAVKDAWIAQQFGHQRRLASLTAAATEPRLEFVVKPYLQFGTERSMNVMWQTSRPGSSIVHFGETTECPRAIELNDDRYIHEVKIDGLDPEKLYFYRAETAAESGEAIYSDGYTFSTAVRRNTPVAFAMIGDTQGNPTVCGKLCKLAWAQRPSFVMHAGDLVNEGRDDSHRTQHFFPGMEESICRVPLFPVLGNHERDARGYYDYMSLPSPEYY